MASLIYEIAYAIWFILPAYVANALPVIFGGGLAVDMGKKFWDGRPIFGSHKTMRGFIVGLFFGVITSIIQATVLQTYTTSDFVRGFPYAFSASTGSMVALGALIGDLAHSFLKRRIGIAEGAPLPVADQLDFVLGGILFSLFVSAGPPILTIIIVVLITPPIHLSTNIAAYLIGLKKTPW